MSDLLRRIASLFTAHSAQRPTLIVKDYWDAWEEQIAVVAPLIKHEGFKAENEWRLMIRLGNRPLSSLEFLDRRTTITRHLPLMIAPNQATNRSLPPIIEIKIGPSRHQTITKTSVEAFLKKKGYAGIRITCSPIPFRSI